MNEWINQLMWRGGYIGKLSQAEPPEDDGMNQITGFEIRALRVSGRARYLR